eukprot:6140839-Ditylum_brightwellii.AAC.1
MSPRQHTILVDCHHLLAYHALQYTIAVDCCHLHAFFKAVTEIMPTSRKNSSINKKFIEAFQDR